MPVSPLAQSKAGPSLTRRAGYSYERRRPQDGTVYQVVRENLETLYAAVEAGFATAPLPKFVRDELERYLDCGILCRGAALLVCSHCSKSKVIALSCKGRGFCPACLGRRMAQTAANLVDHVLPSGVPLRQWVVTFPFELRGRFGFDAQLLGAVSRVVVDSLLGFYERRMRERISPSVDTSASPKLQSGTVTVLQRTNSDFRLNPHLHILALDGVFVEEAGSPPRFEQLPELRNVDVAELITVIRIRVLRLLARRGVIDDGEPLTLLPTDLAEREPVLAELAMAAVSGLPPAGPERRQREPLRLARNPGASFTGPLCATDMGFTLHAATVARRDDIAGREALARYALRPPLAQERVAVLADGRVRVTLKRAFSDGTTAVEMDPLSLLCRLAASVPAPGFHTVRYGGVLAAGADWRPLIVPAPPSEDEQSESAAPSPNETAPPSRPPTHRSRWRPWAELLKRSFSIDLCCPNCGATMKLKSFITRESSLRRLLERLGEPTQVPPRAPARGPPYFKTLAVRRRFGGQLGQLEMFDNGSG